MSACACSPCGRPFRSLSAFDRHQDADYSCRPAIRCEDPAGLGMVPDQYGRWGIRATEASRDALRNLRASRDAPVLRLTPGPSGPSEAGPRSLEAVS